MNKKNSSLSITQPQRVDLTQIQRFWPTDSNKGLRFRKQSFLMRNHNDLYIMTYVIINIFTS